jgi:hypothetical protein
MDTQTRRRFKDQLYGPLADEAAARLRAQGYRARPLALGLPDWRALGLPFEIQRGVSEHDQH